MNVVKQEMNTDSSFFDGAITSFVSLVSIAQSGDKDMFLGAAIWMVQCMADANHTIPHKASCGKRSLRVLTQLIHKSFLLNHFISSANTGWNTFSISSRLLWSPNKEVQLLALYTPWWLSCVWDHHGPAVARVVVSNLYCTTSRRNQDDNVDHFHESFL